MKMKSYLRAGFQKSPLPPSPLLSSLNMDNDCLHLQHHKSEVPIATEQLARLPIIIIINHANFMVFSGTAGDRTGQGAAGASGPEKAGGWGGKPGKEEEGEEIVITQHEHEATNK